MQIYLGWNHEEAQESVREQHLDLLIMTGKISLGVVALVRVSSAPLKPAGGQLVGCQGTGPGSKTKEEK